MQGFTKQHFHHYLPTMKYTQKMPTAVAGKAKWATPTMCKTVQLSVSAKEAHVRFSILTAENHGMAAPHMRRATSCTSLLQGLHPKKQFTGA